MRIPSVLCLGAALLTWFPAAAKPKYTVIEALTRGIGGAPENPPILGADGNLYGAAYSGANGYGAIYTLHTDGTGFAVLYALAGDAGGAGPFGQLLQAPNGLLYGTTLYGGESGQGEVFSYNVSAATFTVVHSFDYADGAKPYGGLISDQQGNLYGTTSAGGANGLGTVFAIAGGTNTFSLLASLSASTGATPFSPLAIGADGMLYGTAATSGKDRLGTIFRLATAGGTVTSVHDFAGSDGAYPFSGLAPGKNGLLYGTTNNGGSDNAGTVFSFQPRGAKFTILHSFTQSGGASPQGMVALDGAGNLLGTAYDGGLDESGAIWRYALATNTFSVLINLSVNGGGLPIAGLTYVGGKVFYGGVLIYGTSPTEDGAVFRFTE